MAKDSKKQKKEKNNSVLNGAQVLVSIAVILMGLIALFGATYAILKVQDTGKKRNVLSTGSFDVNFISGQVINIKNMSPLSINDGMNTTPYKFTLTNNGTMDAIYKVYLEENSDDVSTIPNTDKLMISYKKGDDDYSAPVTISSLYNGNTIVLNHKLDVGDSENFAIKIWLDESAGNEYQNTTYSARIVVESSQILYDITSVDFANETTLESPAGMPLYDYKIYGNDGGVGDLVNNGSYNGKYKIGILSTSTVNNASVESAADIYLDTPLYKYDNTHSDYIDFLNGVVVRWTKIENGNVVLLDNKVSKKLSLPYVNTYSEDTLIKINTEVEPSKSEIKYFKN